MNENVILSTLNSSKEETEKFNFKKLLFKKYNLRYRDKISMPRWIIYIIGFLLAIIFIDIFFYFSIPFIVYFIVQALVCFISVSKMNFRFERDLGQEEEMR